MNVKRLIFILSLFATSVCYSQINNLIHTEDYKTGKLGELGDVQKFGSGEDNLILLPGWGFDWTIYNNLIERYKDDYTIYAVTFPGFGKTQAPPMPENNESYKDLDWTKGIVKGVKDLIEKEKITNAVVLSYFTYSNIIAMRLAIDNPDLVDKVVIISGMAKFTANYPSYEPANLGQRIYYIDNILSKQWFKTVDKSTWDQGNFIPAGLTKDSVKAATYWDQMSSVPIPVMVRYLCEYYCTDLSLEYANLKVPTLVVIPAFTEDVLAPPDNFYFKSFFHDSWWGAKTQGPNLQLITLSDTNAFILDDQPEKFYKVMDDFLGGKLSPFDLFR